MNTKEIKLVKKTFEDLNAIDRIYGKLLGKEGFNNTKLGYAFKRFSEKNLFKIFSEFNDLMEDIKIDNALAGDKGEILYRKGTNEYEYSKEGKKLLNKKIRELREKWNKKEFEVMPYIATDLGGEVFNEEEIELLKGIII